VHDQVAQVVDIADGQVGEKDPGLDGFAAVSLTLTAA
jgi:hypothetical protein